MFPVFESLGHFSGTRSSSSTPNYSHHSLSSVTSAQLPSSAPSPHVMAKPARLSFSTTMPFANANSIQNPIPSKPSTAGNNVTIANTPTVIPPATPSQQKDVNDKAALETPESEVQSPMAVPQSTSTAGVGGAFMKDVASAPNTPAALIMDDSSVVSYGDVYCNTVSSTQSNAASNFSVMSPMRSAIKPVSNSTLMGASAAGSNAQDDNVTYNTLANSGLLTNNAQPTNTQTEMSISMYSDSTTDEVMYQEPDSHISILNSVLSANHGNDPNAGTPGVSRLQQNAYFSVASQQSVYSTQAASGTLQRITEPNPEIRKVAYIVLHFSTPKE
jgi:hypothetical protein